jgi:hypothetical protein
VGWDSWDCDYKLKLEHRTPDICTEQGWGTNQTKGRKRRQTEIRG